MGGVFMVRAGPRDSGGPEARSGNTPGAGTAAGPRPVHASPLVGAADNHCIVALCPQPSRPWLPRHSLLSTCLRCAVIPGGMQGLQTPPPAPQGVRAPWHTHAWAHTWAANPVALTARRLCTQLGSPSGKAGGAPHCRRALFSQPQASRPRGEPGSLSPCSHEVSSPHSRVYTFLSSGAPSGRLAPCLTCRGALLTRGGRTADAVTCPSPLASW